MTCDRCGKETNGFTGSYFNTDSICFGCAKTESEHPAYAEARRVEMEAVLRGDYNFPGVGLPPDLQAAASTAADAGRM